MKRTMSPAGPGTGGSTSAARSNSIQKTIAAERSHDVLSRIKLALLDEYTCEKQGYDPYDTCKNRSTPDLWVSKRKRA